MSKDRISAEYHRFPNHWNVLPFDEAIKDKTGGNPKVKQSDYLESGLIPVLDQGQSDIAGYINDSDLQCRETVPCILFGDHTKIFKYVETSFALGADGVKVLSPIEGFDKRFIFHYLRQLRLPSDAGYSRHFKFLRENFVPKPLLDEQKYIASILDKADDICRKRQQVIQLADKFLRSVFFDSFGDPTVNSKNLPEKPIKDIAQVTTGNTPSREVQSYYGNFIEWIKSDNINTPSHYLTKATEGLSEEGLRVGRSVPAGSTLITCIAGSPSCIGNAALADRTVSFNQQINALTPKPGIEPEFLYAVTLYSKRRIQNASTNSMKGMVSKGALEDVLFILPPEDQREQFVKIFKKVISLHRKLQASAKEAEMNFASLTQRAFNGEL
jgi:type I restriction enzyme S subunit